MALGMLLLALSSQSLKSLALGITVFHYGNKMTRVHEHDALFCLNLDCVKLQQAVHFASNQEKDHSHLAQQKEDFMVKRVHTKIISS